MQRVKHQTSCSHTVCTWRSFDNPVILGGCHLVVISVLRAYGFAVVVIRVWVYHMSILGYCQSMYNVGGA